MAETKTERIFFGRLQLELPTNRELVGGEATVDGVTIELVEGYTEPNFNLIGNELILLAERVGAEHPAEIITERTETGGLWLIRYKTRPDKDAATRVRAVSMATIPLRFDARATASKLDGAVERVTRVATATQRLGKDGQLPANAFGLPYDGLFVSQVYRGRYEKARAVFDLPEIGRLDMIMHSNGEQLQPTLAQRFSEAQETLAAFPSVKLETAELALPPNPNFSAEAAIGNVNGEEEKLIWVSVGAVREPFHPYIEIEFTPVIDTAHATEVFGAIVASLQLIQVSK